MMFDLNSKQLRLWFAVAALGLGTMTLSAPSYAFGGSHGGGGGFHGGGGGFHGGMGGFHGGMGGFHGGMGGFHGGMGGFHGTIGSFPRGGMAQGIRGFHAPVAFAHPGFFRSPFVAHRAFVSRPFFFHRRFADRRFFFHRRRFVGSFAAGFYDGGYDYPYYDEGAYADECFWVRHRVVNRWGHVVIRRTLVCT